MVAVAGCSVFQMVPLSMPFGVILAPFFGVFTCFIS